MMFPRMFRAAFIFGLVLMSTSVSHSSYAGLSFKLTRSADDKFENPTATECNWDENNKKFCLDTNSRWDGRKTFCQCTCEWKDSTFDRTIMKCRNNIEIRDGCTTRFQNVHITSQVKLLALNRKNDKQKIQLPGLQWNNNDKAKSCSVDNITWYHNGSKTADKFITVKGMPSHKNGENGEVKIQWGNNVPKMYYGKMFRVYISYTFERGSGGHKKIISKNDCFVFKSSGSATMTFPSLPSSSPPTDKSTTVLPSSSTESIYTSTEDHPSTKPTGTSTAFVSTKDFSTKSVLSTTKTRTPKPSLEVSTAETVSEPSGYSPTPGARKSSKPSLEVSTAETVSEPAGYSPTPGARKSSVGGGNTAVVVPLVVVACLIIIVAVVLVVIWSRKRAANASKEKTGGTVIGNKSAHDAMTMSTMPENIYAEADNPVNYSSEKGKDNFVYDYAVGNLDNKYTSLDKSKVDVRPYESLAKVQNDIYEQIPAEKQIPKSEPLYHVVDEKDVNQHDDSYERLAGAREIPGRTGNENPERVYSILEDETVPEHYGREVPGRTGDDNPERVYSVLEDEGENVEPEDCGREVPGRTGNENPENVYSVLKEAEAEEEYLTVLPERSEYEQPLNPPMSDA